MLEGKVAIITGGAGGIGRAEALLFAAEGAKVVVADLGTAPDGSGSDPRPAEQVVRAIGEAGGQALACVADVATVEGAKRIVAAAVEGFGRVDILVNGAGIQQPTSMLDMDEPSWQRVHDVLVKGTLWCSQCAARQMIAQGGGGRIVNTTGVGGLRGDLGAPNAMAAEAGVYALTRASARELQPYGITVNALAPVAKTRLTEDLPKLRGLDPLTAEHVAPAALMLASDLCGDRSGLVLAVAGARTFRYALVESPGQYKDGDLPWTAQEIAEHWAAISKR